MQTRIKKFALTLFSLGTISSAVAGVRLYGVADLGLLYSTAKVNQDGQDAPREHSLVMNSGGGSTSFFGIGYEETISPGFTVHGKLEAIVKTDTGEVSYAEEHFFAREASLIVDTPYGGLSFGNMGTLASGAGTHDLFVRAGDVLDGGLNSEYDALACSMYLQWHSLWTNLITYRTPQINGLTGYVQYSGQNGYLGEEGEEGTRDAYRLLALGAGYENGPLSLALVYDEVHMPRAMSQTSGRISFGGNYTFGSHKIYFATQVGRHVPGVGGYFTTENLWNGYMLHLGLARKFSQGSLFTGVYYNHFKGDGHNGRSEKFNVLAAYFHPIAKDTCLYAATGYLKHSMREVGVKTQASYTEVSMGITHRF